MSFVPKEEEKDIIKGKRGKNSLEIGRKADILFADLRLLFLGILSLLLVGRGVSRRHLMAMNREMGC